MIKSGCRGLRESKNALQPQYIKSIVHDKSKIKIIKMTENIIETPLQFFLKCSQCKHTIISSLSDNTDETRTPHTADFIAV